MRYREKSKVLLNCSEIRGTGMECPAGAVKSLPVWILQAGSALGDD